MSDDPETYVFPAGGHLTNTEWAAWQDWFHRNGIKLNSKEHGTGCLLVWSGPSNIRGWVRRDVAGCRISWLNSNTYEEESVQLKDPPLPFPHEGVPMESHNRITVGLIPKAATELDQLVNDSGMTKTDLVNRALTLYAFITERIAAGDHILVRDGETKEVERIRLL